MFKSLSQTVASLYRTSWLLAARLLCGPFGQYVTGGLDDVVNAIRPFLPH